MSHYSIELMVKEHSEIERMLFVIRRICLKLMDGGEVPVSDLREIIGFVRNYADKHHHGKEEKFLFPLMVEKMGRIADNLVTHGMLVEHDLGRGDILCLENALREYEEKQSPELKLDILSYAMAYAHLLQLHVEKENSVVYPFAERQLSEEDLCAVDEKSRAFEEEQEKLGVQERFLSLLERMEERYGRLQKA